MNAEQYKRLKEHYSAVLDADEVARREYLATLSPDERREIELLLAHTNDEFLESLWLGSGYFAVGVICTRRSAIDRSAS